jgi:flavorubredoxin
MATIHEIAPDVYRISVFVPEYNMQFNHFLVKDHEPMLYHTGMRMMFPLLKEAVSTIIDLNKLRWVGFSHFEVDECGSLNDWLQVAPHAQAVCSEIGAMVNMGDYAIRPARGLGKADVLETGRYSYRFIPTPHLPHGWDAGVLFEEKSRTLFCSDLFHQDGNGVAITEHDILGEVRQSLRAGQSSPLPDYMPYTHKTQGMLQQLADLKPATLAIMHGSSYKGDCAKALQELDGIMKEELGPGQPVVEPVH